MPELHDVKCKTSILRRLRALRPDAQRRWGKMSVAQMLWHVNEAMDEAWPDSPTLGRITGRQLSRLYAKHLNHHLTQFGV